MTFKIHQTNQFSGALPEAFTDESGILRLSRNLLQLRETGGLKKIFQLVMIIPRMIVCLVGINLAGWCPAVFLNWLV